MFIVFYVKDCSPSIQLCKTKEDVTKFNKIFKKYIADTNEGDNWVDIIVKGKVVSLPDTSSYYAELLKHTK